MSKVTNALKARGTTAEEQDQRAVERLTDLSTLRRLEENEWRRFDLIMYRAGLNP